MAKTIIATPNAPAAIGTYSQAVRVGDTVYMSGQIGLDPASMQMVDGIDAQIVRVLKISRRWPQRPAVRWPTWSSSTSS
jgi:enamine deaminase RidA (YjgF/YER057c/UK114 family)